MIYLVLVLAGIVLGRWLVPLADLLLEVINHKLATIVQTESIKCRRDEFNFQKEYGDSNENKLEPCIGFHTDPKYDFYEEEDNYKSKK
jgi:hypothetical protein